MGLVATWLTGIGLEYAIPSFTAAGIVTPSALAELDVNHFEALGVKDAEDRRKLFFLVQRIKMAVDRKDESVEEEVDAVLASTMRNASLILDEDDSLEELIVDEVVPAAVPRSPVQRGTASATTTRPKESQKPKLQSPRNRPRASPTKGSVSSNPPVAASRPISMRRHKEASSDASPMDSSRLDEDSQDFEDDESVEMAAAEDSDWDEDSGGDSADDELSSQPDNGRRMSRRIEERQSHSSGSEPAAKSTAGSTTVRSTSLSRPSTGRRSAASKSPRQRPDIATNRPSSGYARDNEATASDNSSTANKPPSVRRLSGLTLPKPKSRRQPDSRLMNHSKSLRTGKQLSSIPAERIAPMSPLVDLPASKLAAQVDRLVPRVGKGRSSLQRPRSNSLDRFSQSGSDSEQPSTQGNNSDSETSRRRANTGSSGEGGGGGPRGRKPSRQSFASGRSSGSDTYSSAIGESVPKLPSRQSTGGSGTSRSLTYSRSSSERNFPVNSGKVTTQGQREDDSFKTQIAQLRDDTNEEHLLFGDAEIPDDEDDDMRIRVVVRKRPMSRAEIAAAGDVDVIHPLDYGSYGKILAYHPRTRVDLTKEIETVPFAFDNVFDEKSTNVHIYERTVRGLIPSLFEGQWASIFAYGQTGSGKTFTMMGSNLTGIRDGSSTMDPSNLGLYYMAALDLFQAIKTPGFEHFTIGVSLFEIYGGKLFDLLNDRKHVKCLEDSRGKVCFPGLSEHGLENPDELIGLIEQGATNRSTGTTSRNADSSRSHAVLQLHLRTNSGGKSKEHSRLTFIDLAGSERGADTSNASRATRLEGAEINTSLLALKEVIRALATGDSMSHVPFRGSKLTQVLKESFVGENCRSIMVACISPNIGNCEQTLNTLRYADRVKERNSESGEPVASNQDGGTRRTSTRKSTLSLPSFSGTSEADVATSLGRTSSDASFESNNSSLLDDLLSSPRAVEAPERISNSSSSTARAAAEDLMSAHKAAMSTMLTMVKNEMTLVNQADADRERLDDYISSLNATHEEQVSLLLGLRERLLRYRAATRTPAHSAVDLSDGDDDSIEDLRD